ncbi:MAG: hypothetical protein K2X74_10265 [Acetobacteraceae bacterium]|nr:hypothetical protein [Acetobacteraceae bacterium]
MGLYTVGNWQAVPREQRGSTTFLFGEIATGVYISPNVSVQSIIHVEPVGEQNPNGTNIGFRYQAAYIESLFLDWRADERLRLFTGKFSAPFGYGHHFFPGVLPRIRAHEIYLIRESIGAGATWTWLPDSRWGEHDITAAAFFFDTSFLSSTAITRKPCCIEGFERYRRNTLQQGGSGNTGNLNNFAIALDGDRIGFLPDFTYHLAMLSRGHGKDGSLREWGWAAGARYLARWTPEVRTLFFGEYVEFRNAGGGQLTATPPSFDPDTGEEIPGPDVALRQRQRFSTLGAQTTYGPWRATAVWQRFQQRRSVEPVPTQQWVELTVGRDLWYGFGIDIGYQYAQNANEEGVRGRSNGIVSRLGFQRSF